MTRKGCFLSLAVAAITFLLALAWLVSTLPTMQYLKSKRTVQDLRAIGQYLQTYHAIHHAYPAAANIDELRQRTIFPLNDSWGNEYVYVTSPDHRHYRLISGGRDGSIERRFLIIKSPPPQRTTSSWDDDIVLQDGRLIQVHEQLGRELR